MPIPVMEPGFVNGFETEKTKFLPKPDPFASLHVSVVSGHHRFQGVGLLLTIAIIKLSTLS